MAKRLDKCLLFCIIVVCLIWKVDQNGQSVTQPGWKSEVSGSNSDICLKFNFPETTHSVGINQAYTCRQSKQDNCSKWACSTSC